MSDDQGTPAPEDQHPEESNSEAETPETTEDAISDSSDAGGGDSEQDATEAAALAAAMAAISQVQGVADSATSAGSPAKGDAQPFSSPEFGADLGNGPKSAIEMLSDVHLDVRIELGRTNMYVEDVLRLNEGAVVELDKLAGDPVDVFVNDRRVARGEVLVLNDMFCVRINEVVDITKPDQ
jgi:flagellar motor switch protein FliN/FliY